jgi:hypothetical protein
MSEYGSSSAKLDTDRIADAVRERVGDEFRERVGRAVRERVGEAVRIALKNNGHSHA